MRQPTVTCDRCQRSNREQDIGTEWILLTVTKVGHHISHIDLCPACASQFNAWMMTAKVFVADLTREEG